MHPSNRICCLILVGILVGVGCETPTAYQAPPPPKVTLQKPSVETIAVYHEENGETEAVEQVIVRARVSGILKEIYFDPGDEITEENLEKPLFQIEQDEYQASVLSAKAAVRSAEAEVGAAEAAIEVRKAEITAANARIGEAEAEFERMKQLKASNAISQSEYDSAQAKMGTAQASLDRAVAAQSAATADLNNAKAVVAKAEADLRQRELDLEWTTIHPPIQGKLVKSLVKVGNLIDKGTELVEIIKPDPIWANFNLSERFLLDIERASEKKPDEEERDLSKIKVWLKRSGDVGFPFEGNLDFMDPKVNQDTGTMKFRAVFNNRNSEMFLIPGLFVRVRIQIGSLPDALLIPERAVGRDQTGVFVYVVDSNNKALRKNIELGTKHGEGLVVVRSGLAREDSVIVDGIQRVRPGIVVDPD